MAIVTLDLNSRDDDGVLSLARTHIAAMTGNADFPTPDPTAVAFLALADNFDAGIQAANAAIAAAATAISAKDDLRVLLEDGLRARRGYVQKESGGIETKILGAALGVKAPTAPIGDLLAPENLRASFGDNPGEIDLIWDRVRGARSYVIDCREAIAGAAWAQAKRSTKSRETVTGLTPGKTYEFRVYAVGSAGDSPVSDSATKMAP